MKFRRQRIEDAQLSITPLIDVVFLLLIFFMVTTTFIKQRQISIDLPVAQGQQVLEDKAVEVQIDRKGQFFINDVPLLKANVETLTEKLMALKQKNGEGKLTLTISADSQTVHQFVVTAMQAASNAGIVHFSITTTGQ